MKRFLSVAAVLCGFSASASAATTTAPLQRIDIVNLLGAVGATTTQSPVVVKFYTAAAPSVACYTATIPYAGSATFYAGSTGLACASIVTTMSMTPGTAGSNQVVYETPTAVTSIPVPATSTPPVLQYYNQQIEVIPDTATPAAFSGTTGAVSTKGAVKAIIQQSN